MKVTFDIGSKASEWDPEKVAEFRKQMNDKAMVSAEKWGEFSDDEKHALNIIVKRALYALYQTSEQWIPYVMTFGDDQLEIYSSILLADFEARLIIDDYGDEEADFGEVP